MCEVNDRNIILTDRLLCDTKCIVDGSFTPLTGFLTRNEYDSVVERMRLPDGSVWPIPIVLPVQSPILPGEEYNLCDSYGNVVASITPTCVWIPDMNKECELVLGTTDPNHPYVAVMDKWITDAMESCNDTCDIWYVGGPVTVRNIDNSPLFINFSELRYSPYDTLYHFQSTNKRSMLGFQTRNPMHRCHIELTKACVSRVEKEPDDTLLMIQPIVGVTQECDVEYGARIKCYKHILNEYNKDNVLLCILPLSMRMAGPREAVWHALIRRNYGCTHFIIGRDHAGPSTRKSDGRPFYGPYDAQKLATSLNLGIEIVTSPMISYDAVSERYVTEDKVTEEMKLERISGTEFRRRLEKGEEIPEWFSPKEVIRELRDTYGRRGLCIYIVGLSASGKSTLSVTLKQLLQEHCNRPITVLDGDIVRRNLSKGLGFSRADRSTNVRRIGYVAYEIVKHGGIVICANIAPYDDDRRHNRRLIEGVGTYYEVFMDTPLEECERRDPKGLYKAARAGKIRNFTGLDDPFERPRESEYVTGTGSAVELGRYIVESMARDHVL